jgi:Reverse transcriptase (RNA-dependent DNA polymerase)
LYYHQILREQDKVQFILAMKKEIQQHNDNINWKIVRRENIPSDIRVLPSVWAMRSRRDLSTGEIIKWKARIIVDGSKQQKGIDYSETFAPVASWASTRIILLLSTLNKWQTRQLDFVQAFPQAPVEKELYIAIPKVSEIIGHSCESNECLLKVLNNIYGQLLVAFYGRNYGTFTVTP